MTRFRFDRIGSNVKMALEVEEGKALAGLAVEAQEREKKKACRPT